MASARHFFILFYTSLVQVRTCTQGKEHSFCRKDNFAVFSQMMLFPYVCVQSYCCGEGEFLPEQFSILLLPSLNPFQFKISCCCVII